MQPCSGLPADRMRGLYLRGVSGHGGKSALCDGKPLWAGSVSGDMSMEQNQLTRDLYAAGCTRENHPSFVYWSDWQNFGYLFEALLKFTWETPCGLLVDGKSDLGRGLACCDASFQGIDYCPEMTTHCCAAPMNARTVHTASAAFLSLSAPATPPANGILSSKAPRRWKRREVRDSTGNTWRLPAGSTVLVW